MPRYYAFTQGKLTRHEYALSSCEFHANFTHKKIDEKQAYEYHTKKRTLFMRNVYDFMRFSYDYHVKLTHSIFVRTMIFII